MRKEERCRSSLCCCFSVACSFLAFSYQHRPLYCSDNDADNCGNGVDATYLRGKLEDIFLKHGVDMVHYGHMVKRRITYAAQLAPRARVGAVSHFVIFVRVCYIAFLPSSPTAQLRAHPEHVRRSGRPCWTDVLHERQKHSTNSRQPRLALCR